MSLQEFRFFKENGDRFRSENDLKNAYTCYISAASAVKGSRCVVNREARATALALAAETLDEMQRFDEADKMRDEAMRFFEPLAAENKLMDKSMYARTCLIRLQKLCLREANDEAVEEAYSVACRACGNDYDALCVAHCTMTEWTRMIGNEKKLRAYCAKAVEEAERAFEAAAPKSQSMALGLYSSVIDSMLYISDNREACKLFGRFETLCDAAKPEAMAAPMVKRIAGKWRAKLRRYFEMEVCIYGKA